MFIILAKEDVQRKVKKLKNWIQESKHTVIFTGAGVSTSAGIPDFRGPKGVWTLEKKGLKPDMNVSWDDAKPTKTHMAISKLVEQKMTKFVISQNIDGLHLRSGIPRIYLAELHGNMFVDECTICKKMYVRSSASTTVGRKISQVKISSVLKKDTAVSITRVKTQISNFEKGCLFISSTYLAEIFYIYMCFPKFS